MKVTLIRNAETEEDFLRHIVGRKNELLNDTGRRQVLQLKRRISDLNYDYCFISPLIRSFETAISLIGDRCEIIRDERLIDREMGELVGRSIDEYNAFQFCDYKRNRSDYGIEPIHDLMKRCEEFISEIKKKYSKKSIMIIVDVEIYRALRHLLKGDKVEGNLLDGKIDFCQMEVFEVK